MWVSIEGLISVGKSTLLGQLREHIPNIVVCPEPVDKWIASGMLQLSYEDPQKYSFPAQCMFFDTRVDQINEVWEKGKVMVSERSPFSDKLFWETKRRNGDVNDTLHAVYENMWKKWQQLTPKECPDLFIYLDASLETCMERLKKRGREAENSVTMEYQRILKEVHEEVFGQGKEVVMPNGKRVPVVRVDCEVNFEEELQRVLFVIRTYINRPNTIIVYPNDGPQPIPASFFTQTKKNEKPKKRYVEFNDKLVPLRPQAEVTEIAKYMEMLEQMKVEEYVPKGRDMEFTPFSPNASITIIEKDGKREILVKETADKEMIDRDQLWKYLNQYH